MNQNKNQLTTTTGNGVALRNASKSLKITNKLLAEVDDFDKHWEWWLSLEDYYRALFLKNVLDLDIVEYEWVWVENLEKYNFVLTKLDIDWFNKTQIIAHLKKIFFLNELYLPRACPQFNLA